MDAKIASFIVLLLLASSVSAQQQVVVLKNGNVLKGVVQRDGTSVEVRSSLTSRIVLSPSQVNYFCDSMDEAYQLIQAESNPSSVESQVGVFRWCMRHQMLDQAQKQIDVLQLMPIKRAELEYLNRQVVSALRQRKKKNDRLAQAQQPKRLPTQGPVEPPGQVRQVGFDKPIEIMPLPSPDGQAVAESESDAGHDRVASIHEIEELSRSFPKESIIKYKRTIEPQMVRNCANAGCHDSRQTKMSLLSIGRGVAIPKRLSQRNLHTMMKYIELDKPLESPLYLYATQAHAELDKAVYTAERGQTRVLREWLLSISTEDAKMAYRQRQYELAQEELAAAQAPQEPPAAILLPGEVRQTSATLPDRSIPSVPNLRPRKDVFVPRDPFDPEIFNRKFGK